MASVKICAVQILPCASAPPAGGCDVTNRGDPEREGSDFTFSLFPRILPNSSSSAEKVFSCCEVYSTGSF